MAGAGAAGAHHPRQSEAAVVAVEGALEPSQAVLRVAEAL